MFSSFTDPGSMSANELALLSQNQLLTAVAVFLLLLFFRAAEKHASVRHKQRSSYISSSGNQKSDTAAKNVLRQ